MQSPPAPGEGFDLNRLLRPNIRQMDSYTPILPFEVLSAQLGLPAEDIIKLDANENPYGHSRLVKQKLAQAPYLHIYPDPESRDLRHKLSDYTGLPTENLLVGHGADELIDLLMRLFLAPGDGIINCPPTFGMYPFDASLNAARTINISRHPDFSLNIPAIEEAVLQPQNRAKLLFVTSPNNPDGSVIPPDQLKHLLSLPLVVVLDEAYVEFDESTGQKGYIHWVTDYPNLIVLRSFSKWAGLAGLRVGYGGFPLPMMTHLWKIKQPYNVNVAGQLAALASLEDVAYLRQNVQRLIATRTEFQITLQDIPWLKAYPSHSNFVLCHVLQHNAAEVKSELARQGILVRYYSSAGLKDHLRFSIGRPAEMETLLESLLKF